MENGKEWEDLAKVMNSDAPILEDHNGFLPHISVNVFEKKNGTLVEVLGVEPKNVSADIEGEYLCIRQKKDGVARIIPGKGKLLKQVYVSEHMTMGKVITKKQGKISLELLKNQ